MAVPYYTAREIGEHHGEIETALQHPNWFSRADLVKNVLENIPRTAVIADIGSGAGELARQLFSMGFTRVTCVDIESYLDHAVIGGQPTFARADISKEAFPIADGSCDVTFAIQVLEHLENPWHAAREILRITKPGGTIVIAIPHATSFINRWKFFRSGDIDTYSTKNNHIAVFTNALFHQLWGGHVRIVRTETAEGYIKWMNGKLRFRAGTRLGRAFTRKIAYILERTT